jgi:hypothetical protein
MLSLKYEARAVDTSNCIEVETSELICPCDVTGLFAFILLWLK